LRVGIIREGSRDSVPIADSDAIDEFTKVAFDTKDRDTGRRFGLDYAEAFHYIGPDRSMDEYIARQAVPL
jgi:hypothetical protein